MGKTVIDAIDKKQKTFKKKVIYYLDTLIPIGKYKDYKINYIIEKDPTYLKDFLFAKTTCFVSDEVSLKLKEKFSS